MAYLGKRNIGISIHALLAESDTVTARIIDPTYDFYPRSPCGERLAVAYLGKRNIGISIHALLAESDRQAAVGVYLNDISIHALLAESDIIPIGMCVTASISIHALLAESDRKSAQNSGALLRI